MTSPKELALVGLLFACLGGCGSPGGPSAVPPWMAAGTVLTFTSAETGLPVSGASVTVGLTPAYTTDSAGRIALRADIARSLNLLTVSHPAYLLRGTYLRDPEETSFTLWPNASATGADGNYARNIVYGATMVAPEHFGIGAPLRRLQSGTTMVSIVPSEDIQRDAEAMTAHRHALAVATMASGGRIQFIMDTASHASTVIRTTTDQNPPCPSGSIGCAQLDILQGYISGGWIRFPDMEFARLPGNVAHEFGHALGFWHSGTSGDVMFVPPTWEDLKAGPPFSGRETFVLSLMYQRRAGNRWPDNDRGVATSNSAGRHTEVISCDFGGR